MIKGLIIHRIWLRMDKRILIIYSTFDCINEMHRISAIALIVLLTLGSIGLNINTHVCQGELKSIRVFIPATVLFNYGRWQFAPKEIMQTGSTKHLAVPINVSPLLNLYLNP